MTPTEQNEPKLPDKIWKNTTVGDDILLAGVGPKPADIMFISPVVSEEEAETQKRVGYNAYIPRKPRVTDCGQWQIIKSVALRHGVDIDSCYVTTIVKALPKNKAHRSRPPKSLIDAYMPILRNEILKVRPQIIVCLGKVVFDTLHNERLKESDIYGAWFYNKEFNCRMYPMMHISQALKPEKMERWAMDFRALATELKATQGMSSPDDITYDYRVVKDSNDLVELVLHLESVNATTLSVDCEWHGNQHVDGKLRSLQICWAPGKAAYIRFMDDKLNYAFDLDYKGVGRVLGKWLNRPEVKYIGHHVSVDLTWMAYWLGLDWYRKAKFDSEFALQICDESIALGLDALALRYTKFGKYDLDLIRWKKANPHQADDGYGLIPDDILIPYALKDVDTVMQAYPKIWKWVEKQGLVRYYNEICNPFVTDVFTFWCLKGIPVNRDALNEMRDLYNWAREEMEKDFRSSMTKDARESLISILKEAGTKDPEGVMEKVDDILYRGRECYAEAAGKAKKGASKGGDVQVSSSHVDRALELVKAEIQASSVLDVINAFNHYVISPDFNIRSKPQMTRWLFDVKKYTPVKSTANKAEGMPAVAWEKIMAYPPEKQALYTPASDKGTLEILARRYSDKVIDQLLELNAVGNLCKAFLKPADLDENGEPVKENGIAYWLASDDRIHLNHSTTETGRKLLRLRETVSENCFNCWDGCTSTPISSQAS